MCHKEIKTQVVLLLYLHCVFYQVEGQERAAVLLRMSRFSPDNLLEYTDKAVIQHFRCSSWLLMCISTACSCKNSIKLDVCALYFMYTYYGLPEAGLELGLKPNSGLQLGLKPEYWLKQGLKQSLGCAGWHGRLSGEASATWRNQVSGALAVHITHTRRLLYSEGPHFFVELGAIPCCSFRSVKQGKWLTTACGRCERRNISGCIRC